MITADFNQLASDWLRPKLRTTKRLDLFRNLISPFVSLYTEYATLGAALVQQMQYTCQTGSMTAMLNDYLDFADRRIWIENVYNDIPVTYLFRDSDGQAPQYLYRDADAHTPQLYLYRDADYNGTYDFIVHIPTAAGLDQTMVAGYVNRYKKAGKRYIIQTF